MHIDKLGICNIYIYLNKSEKYHIVIYIVFILYIALYNIWKNVKLYIYTNCDDYIHFVFCIIFIVSVKNKKT